MPQIATDIMAWQHGNNDSLPLIFHQHGECLPSDKSLQSIWNRKMPMMHTVSICILFHWPMQVWWLGMALHSMKAFSMEKRFFSQTVVVAFCFMLWRLGPLRYWSQSSTFSIGGYPPFSREAALDSSMLVDSSITAGHFTRNRTMPYYPPCWCFSQLQWRYWLHHFSAV